MNRHRWLLSPPRVIPKEPTERHCSACWELDHANCDPKSGWRMGHSEWARAMPVRRDLEVLPARNDMRAVRALYDILDLNYESEMAAIAQERGSIMDRVPFEA